MADRCEHGGRGRANDRRRSDKFYNRFRRAGDPALDLAQRIRNSVRWKRLRVAYRLDFPMCEICRSRGILTPAVDVDHKIALEVDATLAYEWSNLQALCRACHAIKTAAENRDKANRTMTDAPPPDPATQPIARTAAPIRAPGARDWALARVMSAGIAYGAAAEAVAKMLRDERAARFGAPLRMDVGGEIRTLTPRPGDVLVVNPGRILTDREQGNMKADLEAWASHLCAIVACPPLSVRLEVNDGRSTLAP